MSGYCSLHGKTYFRSEGCPTCRRLSEESLVQMTNRVYDRHVPSK